MKDKSIMIIGNIASSVINFRLELIKELLRHNEVILVCQFTDDEIKYFRGLNCKCIDVAIDRRGTNIAKDVITFLGYYRAIIASKPDVILTYSIKPNIYGGLAAILNRKPYIATIEGLGSIFHAKRGLLREFVKLLYTIGLRGAKGIFYLNNEIKHTIESDFNVKSDKLIYTPGMGVNLDLFGYIEYKDIEQPTLVTVGRIMKEKGIKEIIDVSDLLIKKFPNIKWHICGMPEKSEEWLLAEIVKRPWFIYHGQVDDVRPIISSSQVTIIASYHEGLSTICLESMALGRPVIGSDIAGISELIEDNKTGYTFKPKNVKDMQYVIQKFLDLPLKDKIEISKKAREFVVNGFSRQLVNKIYISEIQKTLNN